MLILFLNHKIESCGVYQYGLRLFNILKKSHVNNYVYKEIDSYSEYLQEINNVTHYHAIIYNYHETTMSWLNENNIQKIIKNIGIPHETKPGFFDCILTIDPDENETNNSYNIPRPIYENIESIIDTYQINNKAIYDFINYNEGFEIPIFGSFGFGFQNKGFDKIISTINSQYDKAIIKLVITHAHFDPNKDINVNLVLNLCNSIPLKPNIKLLISHDFFTNEELLLFLRSNTCNIFLYDKMFGRGISSVIDYAISVNKPFIISDSYMFRHIYSDSICIYNTDIKTAIYNSNKLLPILLNKYSNNILISKVDSIIHNIVNNKIENNKNKQIYTIFGCKINAYYYIRNNHEHTEVTNTLIDLFKNFKNDMNKNIFQVHNSLFSDTFPNQIKTLFINIEINNDIITLQYLENQYVSWIDIMLAIENKIPNTTSRLENQIEASIGEIIDKYSILELKLKFISDNKKINDIINELNVLKKYSHFTKKNIFYKMLLYVNEQIWMDTDIIKSLNLSENNINEFARISNQIFENNQKRFRIKNYFNITYSSNIKEHKSYGKSKCYIIINNVDDIYNKIPEINYLYISYDVIYFDEKYKQIINKLFDYINIEFINDNNLSIISYILTDYNINRDIREIFDFETITYKSGGKFGDYLNQLSVICEKYYETGKKGELYIYELPEEWNKFLFGIENTYNDTYNLITSQKYIKNYKIYNGEDVEIDLSMWRNNLDLLNSTMNDCSFYKIFNYSYKIEFSKSKWFSSHIDLKWSNKIVINNPRYRQLSLNCLINLKEKINDVLDCCVFISNEIEDYYNFCNFVGINIEFYKPANLDETVVIINSCEYAILGFSGFAVIANGLHKPHYLIGCGDCYAYKLNNMKNDIPHILDIFA